MGVVFPKVGVASKNSRATVYLNHASPSRNPGSATDSSTLHLSWNMFMDKRCCTSNFYGLNGLAHAFDLQIILQQGFEIE